MLDASLVQAIAALSAAGTAQIQEIFSGDSKLTMLLLPDGHEGTKHVDLTTELLKRAPAPRYRAGTTELYELPSMVEFINRMREPSSVLFADKKNKRLTAILDYHHALHPIRVPVTAQEGDELQDGGQTELMQAHMISPRWGRFRAVYNFPLSDAWKAWSGLNKHDLKQAALARHIEDNIIDILAPDTMQDGRAKELVGQLSLKLADRITLLSVARGLNLTATENVTQAVNLHSGEIQIGYQQTHAPMTTGPAATNITVPSGFLIGVPIFEGDAAYEMLVRLSYRKRDTVVEWSYDIYQADRSVEHAFTTACQFVSEATSLPLFFGAAPDISPVV